MRVFFVLALILAFNPVIKAQGNAKLFQAPKTENKVELAPDNNESIIRYENVADRSILWSKIVLEKVSLKEESNRILYYPVDTLRTEKRSLYYTLLKALRSGRLRAYSDSYFEETRQFEDILPAIRKRDTTSAGFELLNQGKSLSEAYIAQRDISAYDIKEYRLKGVWYFDKRRSELRYRILGIAPVAPDVNFIDQVDTESEEDYLVELFWVWYPDVRPLLAATPAFNVVNANFPISFDRILNTRMFTAEIYRTDNELDDIAALQRDLQFPDFSSGTAAEEERLSQRKRLFDLFKGKKKEENQTTVHNSTKQQ
jgi:gliding motility associated protien GldN